MVYTCVWKWSAKPMDQTRPRPRAWWEPRVCCAGFQRPRNSICPWPRISLPCLEGPQCTVYQTLICSHALSSSHASVHWTSPDHSTSSCRQRHVDECRKLQVRRYCFLECKVSVFLLHFPLGIISANLLSFFSFVLIGIVSYLKVIMLLT